LLHASPHPAVFFSNQPEYGMREVHPSSCRKIVRETLRLSNKSLDRPYGHMYANVIEPMRSAT
jgi:hypothetical protein